MKIVVTSLAIIEARSILHTCAQITFFNDFEWLFLPALVVWWEFLFEYGVAFVDVVVEAVATVSRVLDVRQVAGLKNDDQNWESAKKESKMDRELFFPFLGDPFPTYAGTFLSVKKRIMLK